MGRREGEGGSGEAGGGGGTGRQEGEGGRQKWGGGRGRGEVGTQEWGGRIGGGGKWGGGVSANVSCPPHQVYSLRRLLKLVVRYCCDGSPSVAQVLSNSRNIINNLLK